MQLLLLQAARHGSKLNWWDTQNTFVSIRIASITDPGLKGLGLPADEGHDAVVPDVLDVVNGGAGASVLLLPPPQTSQSPFPFGQAVPACPDPGP